MVKTIYKCNLKKSQCSCSLYSFIFPFVTVILNLYMILYGVTSRVTLYLYLRFKCICWFEFLTEL